MSIDKLKIQRCIVVDEIKNAKKYDEVSKLVDLREELTMINNKIKED